MPRAGRANLSKMKKVTYSTRAEETDVENNVSPTFVVELESGGAAAAPAPAPPAPADPEPELICLDDDDDWSEKHSINNFNHT